MSTPRRMGKENVIHIYNEVFSVIKKSETIEFAKKWIDLESIILNVVTQTQEEKMHVLTHM